jgi:hypothetical protein
MRKADAARREFLIKVGQGAALAATGVLVLSSAATGLCSALTVIFATPLWRLL